MSAKYGLRARLVCVLSITSALLAASAAADSAREIQALCASQWPKSAEQQRVCRERQHAAATALIGQVEGFPEGSREYEVAKTCIERAKVLQPARIDWTRALACFETRLSGGEASETPRASAP